MTADRPMPPTRTAPRTPEARARTREATTRPVTPVATTAVGRTSAASTGAGRTSGAVTSAAGSDRSDLDEPVAVLRRELHRRVAEEEQPVGHRGRLLEVGGPPQRHPDRLAERAAAVVGEDERIVTVGDGRGGGFGEGLRP